MKQSYHFEIVFNWKPRAYVFRIVPGSLGEEQKKSVKTCEIKNCRQVVINSTRIVYRECVLIHLTVNSVRDFEEAATSLDFSELSSIKVNIFYIWAMGSKIC